MKIASSHIIPFPAITKAVPAACLPQDRQERGGALEYCSAGKEVLHSLGAQGSPRKGSGSAGLRLCHLIWLQEERRDFHYSLRRGML